jgi:hypothetical protein
LPFRLNSYLSTNKLSGDIPGSLTKLTKTTYFRLDDNPKLCRLNAASTLAANKCTPTPCPYATCACTQLKLTCPSGASSSTDVNSASPYYPANDATCCPLGATVRERLVTDGHLDCTAGRPCVATTGTSDKGTLAVSM